MQTDSGNIPEITVQQLHEKAAGDEQFFLLDVRTIQEYREAHLSFTDVLIPYDSVPSFLQKLPADKQTPIYAFCRSGRRSGIVTQYLREKGYANVFNVAGGIVAWRAAGYETRSGE